MDLLLTLMMVYVSFLYATGIAFTGFIYPNFTASDVGLSDSAGDFLVSTNGTFRAAMFNPGDQQAGFYLCVIHAASNTVIWTANRNSPVSASGTMSFTFAGIAVGEGGILKWSTPRLESPVSALHLTEAGNLVLLGPANESVWESFRNPTDTIVIGQELHVGTALLSAASSNDPSTGDYKLSLTASDVVLQWENHTYWKLSMDSRAFVNSNLRVEYMVVNQTGVYLIGGNGSVMVIQVSLPPSGFRFTKIDASGQFLVTSFSPKDEGDEDFSGPVDKCRIPLICGKLGLCSTGISVDSPVCSCPSGFRVASNGTTSCVPANSTYSLPAGSCNSTYNGRHLDPSSLFYLQFGTAVDYFANQFTTPVKYGVDLSACRVLCSPDCACLGVFYSNSSGTCYKLENEVGSIMTTDVNHGGVGLIKTIVPGPPENFGGLRNGKQGLPQVAVVLLPLSGILFLLGLAILLWRRSNQTRIRKKAVSYLNCSSSADIEFCIPGLPLSFGYEELTAATENFKTKIGTGGFGSVYKGILPDKTLIAVKRISNLGVRGKKEFCTEIAVIGNIHHVNLVKLKGYCAQRGQWLLVYEYMNRGSLDKTLFGNGLVLEWQERVDIAIGAARGLAYLHTGCDHNKIVHFDIKPENILLHDHFQAKISDFGLSKLLGPEQSSLFTTMRGTRGYLAPEWLTSSAVSDKTDVYSFGMVLFEIVSGRKNCSARTQSQCQDENNSSGGNSTSSSMQELGYFPMHALEMHEQGKYLELVDPRLHGQLTNEDAERLVRVALCCVHEEPGLRPAMASVVGMLEGEIPPGEPRIESLNFLRFYGRGFAEASTAGETAGWLNDGAGSFNGSNTSHASNVCLSYISSQQISGPR